MSGMYYNMLQSVYHIDLTDCPLESIRLIDNNNQCILNSVTDERYVSGPATKFLRNFDEW